MPLPDGVRRLFRHPFRSHKIAAEVLAELEDHLQRATEAGIARGLDPREARRQAEQRFGPRDRVTHEVAALDAKREARTDRRAWWADLRRDLHFALRRLHRHRGFSAVVILTFALGIGANVAIFALVDGVLLRPLPYHRPDRIVRLYEEDVGAGREFGNLTVADAHDWRDRSTVFTDLALFRYRTRAIATGEGTIQVRAAEVSPSFFRLLGVTPALGRAFVPGEEIEGAPPVIVLGYGLWQRSFGGDSGIVGRTIRINSAPTIVIGILPRAFQDPVGGRIEAWFPGDFAFAANDPSRARMMHFLQGFARLRDGTTFADAEAELRTIGHQLEEEYPTSNAGHLPRLLPVGLGDVRGVRPMLLLVMAAAGVLLFLMCANLANLVLARSLTRRHETAVRAALGAGRGRLARGLLLEQSVLVAFGAAAGILTAWVGTQLLAELVQANFPRAERIAMGGRALGFGLGVSAVTMLLTGLLPALLAMRLELSSVLRGDGRGTTTDRSGQRLRGTLVGVQVALAVLLAAGSGLVVRSLRARLDVTLGFEPRQVMIFNTTLPNTTYPDPEAMHGYQDRLLNRLQALPGVVAAGAAYTVPMRNVSTTGFVAHPEDGDDDPPPEVGYNAATTGYFHALGIPLVDGRWFDTRDGPNARPVILVNRALAERFFPGENPVGRLVATGTSPDAARLEIVGVVGDIRRSSLDTEPEPELYFHLAQDYTPSPTWALRLAGDPTTILPAVRRLLSELDPDVPLAGVGVLQDVVDQALVRPRFITVFLSAFAGLALLLSGIGVHGVVAFLVAQRTRELGVRRALGATTAAVTRAVLRTGLTPVMAGLGVGLVAALLAAPVLGSMLYGVAPHDPVTLGGVVLVTMGAAVLGCLLPALRAARVDPVVVLRE